MYGFTPILLGTAPLAVSSCPIQLFITICQEKMTISEKYS